MAEKIFDINLGYISFKNPIVVACMAGITDSRFSSRFRNAGLIILGGYNMDEKTNQAARKEIERGRNEFVSEKPMEFLRSELEAVKDLTTVIAVNVRSATFSPFIEAANLAKEYGAILEINAHCRQPEMMELGVGEALLKDPERLCGYVRDIKKTGVVVSVKIRANVVNDVELAKAIDRAGADIIHIDAMHPDGMDIGVIKRVRNATDMFIIGNNSINDFEDAKEFFSHGADMVSVARAVLKDPHIIDHLVDEVSSFQKMTGWYNAPKHICGGGDLRALAFCCLPVKPCALHGALKQAGFTAEEFMKIKIDFTRGTPLEYGDGTCFGSMAWCCKITKPCFLRDSALTYSGLSDVEYMRIKKSLSEHIMNKRKR
ncbi:MAG: methanogenesis marker 9 domain-containing protein [Candidatus Methanoperedens sp.]|nr:methanogenesis marker 9 domain-containing protein [Candidatus Methanoperedens sp.]MCE8424337.1 methanogenesis marker 9 domain-containing protein [Candidatus Methanoperedens sp.]MCE8427670.1 methanogenesis marker 9 domain-containing protein [Candidatus Methanoperedens sp.]